MSGEDWQDEADILPDDAPYDDAAYDRAVDDAVGKAIAAGDGNRWREYMPNYRGDKEGVNR